MERAVVGVLVGVLLLTAMGLGLAVTRAASVSISLSGSRLNGWGFTKMSESNPGPTITVNQNDVVTLSLTSTDGVPHQFLLDYNLNGIADPGEPVSSAFSTSTTITFTASVGGTFRYLCLFHPDTMHGTWVVASTNTPPTVAALALSPSPAYAGQPASFSATISDPDGDVVSYSIAWGDASTATTGTTAPGGGSISAPHTYASAGSYTLTLTADDGKTGGLVTQTLSVSVLTPASMTLVLTSARTEMMSNETATIDGSLTSGTTPVTAATLTPSSPLGGKFTAVRNLGSGRYEFNWTAPVVTRQTFAPVNVAAKASGFLDTSARIVILVDPNLANVTNPTQLFLLVRSPATSLSIGQNLTVTLYLYTIQGYVVSGATVTVAHVGPGTVSGATDRLNGVYTFTYTAPASVSGPTGVLITISASKLGYASASARLALTVTP